MKELTRRAVLGSTVGTASLFAGCSEDSSSGSFTQTAVKEQQLIVDFEESLEAETISVVDPDGEAFAETSLSAGVSRVTFDIELPYAPGKYRIVATDGDETVAETTQEIQPEIEIVDVGVGANRMDEMPEALGHARKAEALVEVRNVGTAPEQISQLQFQGDLPNPRSLDENRIGIYNPKLPGEAREPVTVQIGDSTKLVSSTLPFTFEGNGVICESEPQSGEATVELRGEVVGKYSKQYRVEYSSSETYSGCNISIEEE